MNQDYNSIPTMLTISQTAQRTGLSAWYIRKLCWDRKIVFTKSGNRYLVNLEKLIDYLNTAPV